MTAKDIAPTSETARQAAELEAMLRMLDLSSGSFSLSIAVCNSPALRDYLIEKLKQPRPDIQVVCIPNGITDVLGYVEQQIDVSQCSAVFIVGLEGLLSSSETKHPVLRSLNASRELWEKRLHCPVVMWLPEYAAGLLSTEAPDLWRYRSHRFEFVSEQAGAIVGTQDYASGDIDIAANLSQDEKRFRIAELEQRIEDAGPEPEGPLKRYVYIWLDELGFLWQTLGQISESSKVLEKLVHMHRQAGEELGMAAGYGNLGNLHSMRGDLDAAEAMYRRSMEISERLDRLDFNSNAYSGLAHVYHARGDLDTAEEYYRKALALDKKLGRNREMAQQLANLAGLQMDRGNLNAAGKLHREALAINKKIGSKQGMTSDYNGLGTLYSEKGDVATAEKMYRKALAISEELGRAEGIAVSYGNLGVLYHSMGNLSAAEEMYGKALTLSEEMGRKEGTAKQCFNLGGLYRDRGELQAAEDMYRKALRLFRDVGAHIQVVRTENLLQRLKEDRRSSDDAPKLP